MAHLLGYCGLCSKRKDTGDMVVIKSGLKTFLMEFLNMDPLNISENAFPAKICVVCFNSAKGCKHFKEVCQKSINKFQQKTISSSMILDKTPKEANEDDTEASLSNSRNKISS